MYHGKLEALVNLKISLRYNSIQTTHRIKKWMVIRSYRIIQHFFTLLSYQNWWFLLQTNKADKLIFWSIYSKI